MFKSVLAMTALLVAAPVLAQGTPEAFNGPFVGIQGGWQQDRQTLKTLDGAFTGRATNKNEGFAYGGQVGYDFRLSPTTVFGAEVALTGRTGRGDLENGNDSIELTQGRTISATARLGYLVDPASLLYIRGGYSNAQYRVDDGFSRVSENRDGYTVGAGYERLFTPNVSGRLEYNYSDFGSDDLPFVAASLGVTDAELKYRRHAVTAGVNFRF